MVSRKRTPAARRRAAAQASNLGEEVRLGRAALGLSVHQAARIASVSWQTVARVEAGDPNVSLLTACAVGEAVGTDVVLRTYPGKPPSLRDTGQLKLAEQLLARASLLWQPTLELRVGEHGVAIDLVFFGTSAILAFEIERRLVNWQSQYRRADDKRGILASQHQRPVHLVLAVEDTRANRRALAPHEDVVRAMLPAGSREVLRALTSGEPLLRDGLLWVRGHPHRADDPR